MNFTLYFQKAEEEKQKIFEAMKLRMAMANQSNRDMGYHIYQSLFTKDNIMSSTSITPEMISIINKLQLCLKLSGRTVETASMKLAEETGEVLANVFSITSLNKEKRYKNKTEDDVIEECIDVILCATSVIMLTNPSFRIEDALALFDKKLNKWINTQGWRDIKTEDKIPTTLSTCVPHMNGIIMDDSGKILHCRYEEVHGVPVSTIGCLPVTDGESPTVIGSYDPKTGKCFIDTTIPQGRAMWQRLHTLTSDHRGFSIRSLSSDKDEPISVPVNPGFFRTRSDVEAAIANNSRFGVNGILFGEMGHPQAPNWMITGYFQQNSVLENGDIRITAPGTNTYDTKFLTILRNKPIYNEIVNYVQTNNDKLLDIVITYPEVENIEHISKFTPYNYSATSDGIRYDAYVTKVFNMLEHLYLLFLKYIQEDVNDSILTNKSVESLIISKCMSDVLGYTEYLNSHRMWWLHNKRINIGMQCYNPNFVSFVDAHYIQLP